MGNNYNILDIPYFGKEILLDSDNISAVTYLDISLDNGYDEIKIILSNIIPDTDTANLIGYVSNDGGSSFITGVANYSDKDANTLAYMQFLTNVGSNANEGASLELVITGANSDLHDVIMTVNGIRKNNYNYPSTVRGQYLNTTDYGVDYIRFGWSSGDFEATGNWYKYGLRRN